MINKYILNSKKIVEPITVEYTNGIISNIIMPVKYPLNIEQYEYLIAFIPYHEQVISGAEKLGSGLYVTKEIGANKKIAMFCTHYMNSDDHNGQKYVANKKDGEMIRRYQVTDELLAHYFKSQNFLFKGKHSIRNFCSYYNELVADLKSAGKSKFPDYWAEKFENSLKSPQEIKEYWTHLRSLGLSPKKDRLGKTTDWIKENLGYSGNP